MTYTVKSYSNADGQRAEILYNKYDRCPHIDIIEPIEKDNPCGMWRTIYTNYYSNEESAKRAIKAYAKRHDMKPFTEDKE